MEEQTNRKQLNRGAGILMPVSSLPSPYGIGTLGEESYRFVDFLKSAGCKYWQVLPAGPTSFGDSPYQSFSAFAGNPYFIDLDYLVEETLLRKEEVESITWGVSDNQVSYETIYHKRFEILRVAFERSNHQEEEAFLTFCDQNRYWLDDYCLYMAVKTSFANEEWLKWDDNIRNRDLQAVKNYTDEMKEDIEFWKFCQYKFRHQWDKLKQYANCNGISIIGDIPLYVAMDSSDVWVHGDLFELDERKKPIHVAGVPPDIFSKTGQRWGNPLYRWDKMEKDNFTWWRERMKMMSNLYDVIRIDHFIGLVNYYSIPETCPTAVKGSWIPGPGKKLTDVINESIGEAKIIAEDLGVLTPNVKKLIKETGYPGMKVLLFGLDGPVENDYLPHNYATKNTIAYIGTHDNETLAGFLAGKNDKQLEFLKRYFHVKTTDELMDEIIRTLYASIADVAIIQMQDILKLDNKARMNKPSTVGGNWEWRMLKEQYEEIDRDRLYEMAYLYGRVKPVEASAESNIEEE